MKNFFNSKKWSLFITPFCGIAAVINAARLWDGQCSDYKFVLILLIITTFCAGYELNALLSHLDEK